MARRTDTNRQDVPHRDFSEDILHAGWEQAVEDMRVMARDREGRGYDALTIVSGNTAPIAPSEDNDNRIGFSHLVDSSDSEAFIERYEGGYFAETGVYQAVDGGHVFLVTEHIDHDHEVVIFIAGTYRVWDAVDLVGAALERGELYTYVRKLDRTVLGSFEHDDVSAFFPDPDLYLT